MATMARTTHSMQHYHYIFTVMEITVKKMEAHVYALSREEADLLFNKACPNVWTMLDVRDLGAAKKWMIRGRKTALHRSHVDYVGPYFDEDGESAQPFTDFVNLYVDTFKALPLPSLRQQLFSHRGTHVPTAEQIEIIADETGVTALYIKRLIRQEFRSQWFQNTAERFGRAQMLKVVTKPQYEECSLGRCSDELWEKLCASFPNFGVERQYRMTVGELLFFYDMNSGLTTSHEIYSGAISVLDLPKRELKHLCTIDSRFAELAAQEQKTRDQ